MSAASVSLGLSASHGQLSLAVQPSVGHTPGRSLSLQPPGQRDSEAAAQAGGAEDIPAPTTASTHLATDTLPDMVAADEGQAAGPLPVRQASVHFADADDAPDAAAPAERCGGSPARAADETGGDGSCPPSGGSPRLSVAQLMQLREQERLAAAAAAGDAPSSSPSPVLVSGAGRGRVRWPDPLPCTHLFLSLPPSPQHALSPRLSPRPSPGQGRLASGRSSPCVSARRQAHSPSAPASASPGASRSGTAGSSGRLELSTSSLLRPTASSAAAAAEARSHSRARQHGGLPSAHQPRATVQQPFHLSCDARAQTDYTRASQEARLTRQQLEAREVGAGRWACCWAGCGGAAVVQGTAQPLLSRAARAQPRAVPPCWRRPAGAALQAEQGRHALAADLKSALDRCRRTLAAQLLLSPRREPSVRARGGRVQAAPALRRPACLSAPLTCYLNPSIPTQPPVHHEFKLASAARHEAAQAQLAAKVAEARRAEEEMHHLAGRCGCGRGRRRLLLLGLHT